MSKKDINYRCAVCGVFFSQENISKGLTVRSVVMDTTEFVTTGGKVERVPVCLQICPYCGVVQKMKKV